MSKLTLFGPYEQIYDIDQNVMQALDNYFFYKFDPGSFVTACLCSDLIGAALRAHPINIPSIGHIGQWIAHNAPKGSWGSAELVQDWLAGGKYYQEFNEDFMKKHVWNILSDETR